MQISLIISVYNERDLVDAALNRAYSELQLLFDDYELIVVNDGSTDGSGEIISTFCRTRPNAQHIDNLVNMNLGLSLRRGFAAAQGDIVLYNSIDLPLNCQDIPVLIESLGDADVLVVERRSYPGATLWRRMISKVNRLVMKSLFPVATRQFWDMNYVQLFRRSRLTQISPLATSPTFTPIEMIIRAHRCGLKIHSTGADYHKRTRGVGSFGKPHDILWALYDAFRFRIRCWVNKE